MNSTYYLDKGTMTIQQIKGKSLAFLQDDNGVLNLSATRTMDAQITTMVMRRHSNTPLFFSITTPLNHNAVLISSSPESPPMKAALHRHDYFEISIIAEQGIEMQIESSRKIYSPGDVLLINRNTRHAEENLKDATLYTLCLSKDYLVNWPVEDEIFTYMCPAQETFFRNNLNDESKRNRDYIECLYQGTSSPPEIILLFNEINLELEKQAPGYMIMVRGLIYRLFALLSDTGLYTSRYLDLGADHGESLAESAKNFLDKKKRKISREELTNTLHYSATHINRIFTKFFGMTAKEYNRQVYLQEAARLLTSTNLNIDEIIRQIGLESRTHFYRQFEEIYHVTPAKYRQFYKNTEKNGTDPS